MAEEGLPGRVVQLVLGALLAFVGALTLGNAPYAFLGYGLSAFAVFALGLLYRPSEAVAAVFVGMVAGVAVDLRAGSVFTFVGIGAVVVRTLQVVVLARLRPRLGDLASALVALLVGVFLAIAVGLATYGGSGIQPAFAVFDVVYLAPAMLLVRVQKLERSRTDRAGLALAIVVATLVAFASAAAFLLVAPLVASLAVLAVLGVLLFRPRLSAPRPSRSSAEVAVPFVLAALLVAILLVSGPALGYAIRAVGYPLYGDSLAARQWVQTDGTPYCRPGNVAGGGTEANGTWGVARLRLLSTCVYVTGIVEALTPTSGPAVDGDYGMDIKVDAGYEWTLSLGSYVLNGGLLHVEVVPSDQAAVPGILTLAPGDHVKVVGAWVLDTDHGWTSEIHPAWAIALLPPG